MRKLSIRESIETVPFIVAHEDQQKTSAAEQRYQSLLLPCSNQLDTHKTMGPGGIHPRVLRDLAEEQKSSLSHSPSFTSSPG